MDQFSLVHFNLKYSHQVSESVIYFTYLYKKKRKKNKNKTNHTQLFCISTIYLCEYDIFFMIIFFQYGIG